MATATTEKETKKQQRLTPPEALILGDPNLWELTAKTITYPMEVEGGAFVVYCQFDPYQPPELIKALERSTRGWVRDGRETRFLLEEDSAYIPMFDRHFQRMIGTSSDKDVSKQVAYMDAHPELKAKAVKGGFGGVALKTREITFLDLDSEGDDPVYTHQLLYNVRAKEEGEVNIVHHLNSPNNQQIERYRKAQSRVINNATAEWRIAYDSKTLGQIYDDMVDRVDGFIFGGQPCDHDSKKHWAPLIPLWHKFLVMIHRFREGAVKKT